MDPAERTTCTRAHVVWRRLVAVVVACVLPLAAACSDGSGDGSTSGAADGSIVDSTYCRELPDEVAAQYAVYYAAVRKDPSPPSETEAIADLYTNLEGVFAASPAEGIRAAWAEYAELGEQIIEIRRANPDPDAAAGELAGIGGEVRLANDGLDEAITTACGEDVAKEAKQKAVAAGD
jgi:hypothetical protein